jgi:hypothetical protein
MRTLDGEQVLMRVFIGQTDKWEHRPLYAALLELFRAKGLAGATVLQGIAGFGPDSILHQFHVFRLSQDLPIDATSMSIVWTWPSWPKPAMPLRTVVPASPSRRRSSRITRKSGRWWWYSDSLRMSRRRTCSPSMPRMSMPSTPGRY